MLSQRVAAGATGGLRGTHRQTDGDAGGAGQAVGVGDGVVAAAAVEHVVAGAGVEDVVERVAGQVGAGRRIRMRPFSTLAVRV
jgi:hypothetical protein